MTHFPFVFWWMKALSIDRMLSGSFKGLYCPEVSRGNTVYLLGAHTLISSELNEHISYATWGELLAFLYLIILIFCIGVQIVPTS